MERRRGGLVCRKVSAHWPVAFRQLYATFVAQNGAGCRFITMKHVPPQRVTGDGPDRGSRMYWLNIDVNINDLIRQQQTRIHNFVVYPRPLILQYCVLHGVGTVANALTVGEQRTDIDRFAVSVTTFAQTEESESIFQRHRRARMIWSEVDPRAPRLEIYIKHNMLRHLVELYVTKRIDAVGMFMQIAVMERPIEDSGDIDETPLLDEAGHLYFRRTQCELLSVYASLARIGHRPDL
jgi:hypothetical protein